MSSDAPKTEAESKTKDDTPEDGQEGTASQQKTIRFKPAPPPRTADETTTADGSNTERSTADTSTAGRSTAERSMAERFGTTNMRTFATVLKARDKLKHHHKKHKKKKDDEEIFREQENRERYLRLAGNLQRAHSAIREQYLELLQDKVEHDRERIAERAAQWQLRLAHQHASQEAERKSKVPKKTRTDVAHDQHYLDTIPKSRVYRVLQLRDEYKREGKIRNKSDEQMFWEDIKSGNNPVDEEMRNRIRARRGQQAAPEAPGETVQIVEPEGWEDTHQGDSDDIKDQLPNLLNIPQFTKRRRSSAGKLSPHNALPPEFRRPELPKFKYIDMDLSAPETTGPETQLEAQARRRREENRKLERKNTQVMYQAAITNMAITNRLLGNEHFQQVPKSAEIRDLVDIDLFRPETHKMPNVPAVTYKDFYHPPHQIKLEPLEAKLKEREEKDKAYDKPNSTKSNDRRRVKSSDPIGREDGNAALSLQSILSTSVVKEASFDMPNWHRGMWSNYTHIGVTNPDLQSQKWQHSKSNFGEELANPDLIAT